MQYLASVFGFLGRDSGGGTWMALLGACWTVTGVLTLLSPVGSRNPVLGFLLLFARAARRGSTPPLGGAGAGGPVQRVGLRDRGTRHRAVLPVLRWRAGRAAVDGSERAQVKNVEHEAGVQEQL